MTGIPTRGASHNAAITGPIEFEDGSHDGTTALYRAAKSAPKVSLQAFRTRLNRRIADGAELTEEVVAECLYTDGKAYRQKYGRRRTRIALSDGAIEDLEVWHRQQGLKVPYPMFRQRVKAFERNGITLDAETLAAAGRLDATEWRDISGGGRRTPTELNGELFPSLKAALRSIGREDDYPVVKSRLSKHWSLESALEPVREGGGGTIYRIMQYSTGLLYFGLTSMPYMERWRLHLRSAEDPKYPLHREINRMGVDDFKIDAIEEHDTDEALGAREKALIKEYGTIWPNGLNGNSGGAIGGGRVKRCTFDGVTYNSVGERNQALGKKYGLEPWVVGTRIREGLPLSEPQRRVNKDRLADPDQQRQWLKLKRLSERGEIELDPRWLDPHAWHRDVDPDAHVGLHFVRRDPERPYGPDNFDWLSEQDKMARIHGKGLSIHGRWFQSLTEAAEFHGLPVSTLKYRIQQGGMTPEQAVAAAAGPTAGKTTIFEGEEFATQREAAQTLAERHGLSVEQARDRIKRNVPTSRWPKRA